jgi:Leucine-rich repeat (LRR) protein
MILSLARAELVHQRSDLHQAASTISKQKEIHNQQTKRNPQSANKKKSTISKQKEIHNQQTKRNRQRAPRAHEDI